MVLEDQIAEGRRREAFGAIEDDTVEVVTQSGSYEVEVTDPGPVLTAQMAFLQQLRVGGTRGETFEDVAIAVFDEAFDLLVARQRKYGPGNIETLGQYGVFTRMEDKMERIRHGLNGKIVNGQIVLDDAAEFTDETLDDADLDLMNYACIRLIHRRGKWGKPLADEVNAE